MSLSHPILPVFVSLPNSAVSCIPLPPPTAPSQCLCCKQSFLPPFILVKSFQIYYALTKLSVGPWLECCPGSAVTFCLFFSSDWHFYLPFGWKSEHGIYIIVAQRSGQCTELILRQHIWCFCNSVVGFFAHPSVWSSAVLTPTTGW